MKYKHYLQFALFAFSLRKILGTDMGLLSYILTSQFPLCNGTVWYRDLSFIVVRSLFSTKYWRIKWKVFWSESLSKKNPNGLFPSPGAKLIILSAFSTMLDSCNNVSVTPKGCSSTSYQSLSSLTGAGLFIFSFLTHRLLIPLTCSGLAAFRYLN